MKEYKERFSLDFSVINAVCFVIGGLIGEDIESLDFMLNQHNNLNNVYL
ncbi:MAG: hypothetical protein FWF50_01835 [Defluviitaleaceae bacterium]|nr:hypothetical protein [Defluviitaleaceae bacterium]